MLSFGAVMMSPQEDLLKRVERLYSRVTGEIIPEMTEDSSLYSKQKVADVVRKLSDSDIVSTQTAEGILTRVRSAWLRATPDYYYGYNSRMSRVTQ